VISIAVAVAVALAGPAADVEAEVDPFAACAEAAERATPRQRHRCVYMAARKTGDFDRAEALLSTATVHPAWALLALGHVRSAVGDPRAEDTYEQAVQALHDQPEGLVYAELGLRFLHSHGGRHDEARQAIARAREAAGDDEGLRARVDVEDARMRWQQGDAQAAVDLASAVSLDGADHQLLVLVYHVLAGATLELGQVGTSWSYSERLVDLAAAAGDLYVEATARLNALAMLEDHPELTEVDRRTFAEQTLAVAEAGGNPFAITGARCMVGALSDDEATLLRCLAEARQLDDPNTEALALRHLADRAADAEGALAYLDDAEAVAAGMGQRFTVAQVQHRKAAALWGSDRDRSEAEAERAVRTIEGVIDTHGDELSRAGFASIWRTAWLAPAVRWRGAADDGRAFRWVERMRARELRLEQLGGPADATTKERIAALQERLWDDLTPAARAGLVAQLAEVEAQARVELPTLGLAEVQGRLRPDQALAVYVLADEPSIDSWLWVIERDEIRSLPMPEPQQVAPSIELLLGLQQVPEPALAGLRGALVQPLLEATDAAHLVVVPDGPLHRLPLGLFVRDRTVTTVPSATVWASLATDTVARGVVSLADPAGQDLPYARAEGRHWHERIGGELWLGSEATRAHLLAGLADHDVVHLATHADVDGDRAEHRLALADGPLSAAEIAALDLAHKVVVLAACRGGDGPVYSSEGAISLARAFLQGGARAVLTSVVPLRDDQASDLFAAVGVAWSQGGTLAEAVQVVQQERAAVAPGELGWAGLVIVGDGDVVLADVPQAPWSRASWAVAVGAAAGGSFLLGFAVWRRRRIARSG